MVLYGLFLSFGILVSLFIKLIYSKRYIRNYSKAFLLFWGAYLVLLSGVRNESVGTDVLAYKSFFMIFGKVSLFDNVPASISGFWGYRLICKIVFIISRGNYQVMLFFSAAIIIYGFFKFIYLRSDNCIASVFYFITLYYFFVTWNVVRQSMAMSLMLLALMEIEEKKYLKGILLIIVAISVHNISIIMGLYCILIKIRWNKRVFITYSILLFTGIYLIAYIIQVFIYLFPRYGIYKNKLISDGYSLNWGASHGRKIIVSAIFLIIIIFCLIFFEKYKFETLVEDSKRRFHNSLWLYMALTMVDIVLGITHPMDTFYLRIQSFFSIFSILFLPGVIERIQLKWRLPLYFFSNMLFVSFAIVRLLSNNSGVYPYKFFY